MDADNLVYGDVGNRRRSISLAIFCVWVIVVSVLAWNHVVWRDEVKAYSFALQSHNIVSILTGLHGEGHPALWYLLIHAGHVLFPRPQVLQIIAFAVAFASMLLLVLRSPFSLLVLALLLSSHFALFEYSVMARNYGISMLLLFLLATFYHRHRDRGVLLGSLLFLLANCNVHSVLLVVAFLVFWLLDIVWNSGAPRPQAVRNFLLNAAIAILGIALCAVTVFPPDNDVARMSRPGGIALLLHLIKSLLLPAQSFSNLLILGSLQRVMGHLSLLHPPFLRIFILLMSALLFGSTLGLVRRPAALLASWTALIGFTLFFNLLYPGMYRYEALWLIFLVTMYWIAGRGGQQDASGPSQRGRPVNRAIQTAGYVMFLILLVLQSYDGLRTIAPLVLRVAPEGRSRDLGLLISRTPELQRAIILADPDYELEALPYYLPNPTYLMREHRFGNIVHFTTKATLKLSLDDILNDALQLRAQTGRPVVILLLDRLDPSAPAQVIPEAYDWQLSTTPEQVRRFQASTRLIQRFGPVSFNDETYDVYAVD